jgi:hypothetical protein
MTIIEAITEVKDSLTTVPAFFYADLNEANLNADLLANSAFPLMILLPIRPRDRRGRTGVLKTSCRLQGFFLNKKTDQATIQYDSLVIENEIIVPMRTLGRQFFYNLGRHSIIDREDAEAVGEVPWEPTFSALDANVHGVYFDVDVKFIEGITGCH